MNRAVLLSFVLSAVMSTFAFADDDLVTPRPAHSPTQSSDRVERHLIVEATHPLDETAQAALAARGLTVQHVMPGNRYVVAAAAGASLTAGGDVRDITTIGVGRKLHPTAWRQAARAGAFATLNILFHDDVTFAEAQASLASVGGMQTAPLQADFQEPRRITARVPSGLVEMLAADDRVLAVYGPRPRIKADNAIAAQLSEVTPLFDAPYGLTGNGVSLSIFDVGKPDSTHPDFNGRLTTHTTQAVDSHPTHVSGTLIGTGKGSVGAKGMAPSATLQAYDVNDNDGDFITAKRRAFSTYTVRADNNSWGYLLGWNFDSDDLSDWVWEDADEYIGAYDFTDASIDKLVRSSGTLIVFSAGNEANNPGPTAAPFKHYHVDDTGSPISTEVFCYSSNGTGTDCPVPTCSAGLSHCEITRHPVRGPYNTMSLTASSKNVLAVGAIDTNRNIASFSSRGPTVDGRVKPDLVAKGVQQFSTLPNAKYGNMSGTSMSSPVVTGITALLLEQWRKTFGGVDPAPSTLKALLISGAVDLGNGGPDYTFGFGLVDAKNSIDTVLADGGAGRRIRVGSLTDKQQMGWDVTINSTSNLRFVLGWDDPEVLLGGDDFAATALVNDLDLQVTDPNGNVVYPYVLDKNQVNSVATRAVNHVDNVEEVEIRTAAPGKYHISVTGSSIVAQSPQTFTLVSSADIAATDTTNTAIPTAPHIRAARH
jgi:hypothetical protein